MNAARDGDALRQRKITSIINCAQSVELRDVLGDEFHIERLNMVEHPFPATFNATNLFQTGTELIESVLSKGSHPSASSY
jgi:hypothetical protein